MDLICLGDSLTFGLGVRRGRCWTALFAEESGWNVSNRGISGDTTSGMLARLHRVVLTALGEDRSQCRVLVMGGTNDILFSGTDTGAKANLTAMVYQLKACGVQPMVGIPLPVDWARVPEKWRELVDFRAAAAQVQAYADWLRAYCRGSGSLTVDFAADFYRPDGQLCQEMLWDGLHPSEDGHSKMAERLARLLLRKG